jgi:4-aminobutyrate aminotransferase-like enzyme
MSRVQQAILEHPDFGRVAVAALVVEVVQGAGRMTAALPGPLPALRSFTKRHGMLLIVDEIFSGFGRTGTMWGFQHDGVVPDLITIGKAAGGGLAFGAVLGPRPLLDSLASLKQTSTFSGNPVACAAGAVTHGDIDIVLTRVGTDGPAGARRRGAWRCSKIRLIE